MTALLPYILQDMPTEVETPDTSCSSVDHVHQGMHPMVSERGKDFDPDLSGYMLH